MLPAQLLSVLHYPLWMPSSYPPFAKYAKDGAPAAVVPLQFEGRATRPDLQQKHTQLEDLTWQAFVSFHQTTRATSLIAEPAWLRPRGEMQYVTCLAPSHCVAAGTSECRQK